MTKTLVCCCENHVSGVMTLEAYEAFRRACVERNDLLARGLSNHYSREMTIGQWEKAYPVASFKNRYEVPGFESAITGSIPEFSELVVKGDFNLRTGVFPVPNSDDDNMQAQKLTEDQEISIFGRTVKSLYCVAV